jgi:thiosulfate dehydrogenase
MKDMTPMRRAEHKKQKQLAMLSDGKQLFGDSTLGKNGRSCESCHPGGGTNGGEEQIPMRDYSIPIPTLVGAAARFPQYKTASDRVITLAQANNNCISMFLGGDGLELNSRAAIALSMYVTSLSNGESVQIGQPD